MSKSKPKVTRETTAITLSQIQLAPSQNTAISQPTPPMFVKTKPGRGGKPVSYVETGYVVSRLNATFSPAGWDFEILEQGKTDRKNETRSEGEVWVRGKLTIVDHKNGFRVSKTQYGQHPIHEKVPIGDAYKSAASDCLKKCASMFGIAHDIYWGITETEGAPTNNKPVEKPEKKTEITAEDIKKIKVIIENTNQIDALLAVDEKIQASKLYKADQKKELHNLISRKVDEIDSKN